IGNAMDNGAELICNFPVTDIEKIDGGFMVKSGEKSVSSRYVINCAGLFSDKIAAMVGDESFSVHPRRGEYILLDKECGGILNHTVFRTPSKMGKGILVSPTVDGNLLLGPTSVDIEDKDDKTTTAEGFQKIIKEANENVNGLDIRKTITSFCGLRAVGSTGDFIINSPVPHFINAAGIESPGLSASPAIAMYIESLLRESGLILNETSDYEPTRPAMHRFREASIQEKNEIIKKDRAYGKIVCRCETVTEGEILEAIRRNPKPRDLDGVKRRTRAQMGRCQGGFCGPYIVELLAREQNIPFEDVTKSGGNSYVNLGKTKEAAKND
ncbi:MAG: FAD-dependent oxidoreductase, partial [Clostridia bacterium]|nr:FAD-dependent oxidoreductase [Clostridia bacterium]